MAERYFVTGATGFIGQHLCRHLVERGDEVHALVRNEKKARDLPDSVHVVSGDLTLFEHPDTRLPECDVVVHLAGVVAADSPEQYRQINLDAVGHLIGCLERQAWAPRRLLFASSLAAAGPSSSERPRTEADPPRPIEPYGEAKAAAELLVRDAAIDATSFRPCLVLGPRDPATLTLFEAARRGVGMRVAGTPQQLSFVDVRDVVDAIVLMAEDDRPGTRTYYVSHPESVDVLQLWRAIGRAVGRRVRVAAVPRPVLYLAMRASTLAASLLGYRNQLDLKQYQQLTAAAFTCSSQRLREELGWRPRYGLDAATENAARGYREAALLP